MQYAMFRMGKFSSRILLEFRASLKAIQPIELNWGPCSWGGELQPIPRSVANTPACKIHAGESATECSEWSIAVCGLPACSWVLMARNAPQLEAVDGDVITSAIYFQVLHYV